MHTQKPGVFQFLYYHLLGNRLLPKALELKFLINFLFDEFVSNQNLDALCVAKSNAKNI